ncbi:hypothetical protein HZA98_01375 [Candidatus Woesearchaeota archaeon]|nr:hypothetical protein [Candidatus Woesearchaeota archaeon]
MRDIEVYKSGGVSSGTAEGYVQLGNFLEDRVAKGYQTVAVVSAPAYSGEPKEDLRVTELLRRRARGEHTEQRIIDMYTAIAEPLGISFDVREFENALSLARSDDEYLYLGEHFQAQLFATYLHSKGMRAEWLDARGVLQIDSPLGVNKVRHVFTEPFSLENCDVFVMGGFYGNSIQGQTLTLPSGGSDLSADVVAASLCAKVYGNLKAERGILATNPKFVPHAKQIGELTYREVRELSYGGNQVLQEEAMSWCRREKIPIVVRSLFSPDNPGTRIVAERDVTLPAIVGIASSDKERFVVYNCRRDPKDSSYFREIFDIFSRRGISLDMIATNNGFISLAVREKEYYNKENDRDALEQDLGLRCNLQETRDDQALISVVGEGISNSHALRKRILEVVDHVATSSYGPILGGAATEMTVYHIEKFGMNSEKGFATQLAECFDSMQVPIHGVSTTIDSMSIGTHLHRDRKAIEDMCRFLQERLKSDTISVRRNRLLLYGPPCEVSNVTISVAESDLTRVISQLYAEFFE